MDKIVLIDMVSEGAKGDSVKAVEACKEIILSNLLVGRVYPANGTVSTRTPKTYGPNDRGLKTKAKRDGGLCPDCKKTFKIGDDINVKTKDGRRITRCQECADKEDVPF